MDNAMLMLFQFLGWVLIGGAVGVAIGRGRGWKTWESFLMGGLLGLLGWIIIGVSDHRARCKACGKPLEEGAKVCAYCMADVRGRYKSFADIDENKNKYECPNCHCDLDTDTVEMYASKGLPVVCKSCGQVLQTN